MPETLQRHSARAITLGWDSSDFAIEVAQEAEKTSPICQRNIERLEMFKLCGEFYGSGGKVLGQTLINRLRQSEEERHKIESDCEVAFSKVETV